MIGSYLKDDAFTAVKGMQSSKQGMWKGYHLSIEGVLKGYLFREKMVYKRVRGLTSGWSKPSPHPFSPSKGDLYFQQIAWLSKTAWPSVLYWSCDGNYHQITFIFCSSAFSSYRTISRFIKSNFLGFFVFLSFVFWFFFFFFFTALLGAPLVKYNINL